MTASSPPPLSDAAWIELERTIVAAMLRELDPADVAVRVRAVLSKHLSGELSAEPRAVPAVGNLRPVREPSDEIRVDDTNVLLGPGLTELTGEDRERLTRLLACCSEATSPLPTAARSIHRLRNGLTGTLTNVELLEMMLMMPSKLAPQSEILGALRLAIQSCHEMTKAVDDLSRFVERRTPRR